MANEEVGKEYNKKTCVKTILNGGEIDSYTIYIGYRKIQEFHHNKNGKLVYFHSFETNRSNWYKYDNNELVKIIGTPVPSTPNKNWIISGNRYEINVNKFEDNI